MSYKITYGHTSASFNRTGDDVVKDYLDHSLPYYSAPGIEEKIERLATLVGLISDKLGINLLEIIEVDQVHVGYVYTGDKS